VKQEKFYAQIVFPLPLDKSFDYAVPSPLREKIAIGERVRAPFGKMEKVGYVIGLSKRSFLPSKAIKPIYALLDEEPLLDERLLELSKRIHSYYLCSWGEALEAVFPASLKPRKRAFHEAPPVGGPLETPLPLDEEQKNAFTKITEGLDRKTPKTFLLVGGSENSKMELIFQVIQNTLEKDFSSIILYPEISLAKEAAGHFKRRFGKEVCLFHSELSPLERYDIWTALRGGRHRVVVGTRSAIFSPVRHLGLVVCFEENDTSYKQEETPRYHVREVALMRSEIENASFILESNTPTLESYAKALRNRYTLLQLSEEDPKRLPPKVSVVDMRQEGIDRKRKLLFSNYLERRMRGTLEQKGQILLFLNRRGFSTFVHCQKCGTIIQCKVCRVPLKYHSEPKCLICHYCNAEEAPPSICPVCRQSYLQYTGAGTERVESEVHRLFPEARIARLDADAMKIRQNRTRDIADAFRGGELDILIGTQRVVRERVPGGIPLVGILSADTLLNTPDFRAAERAFTILSRLIGQAAREGAAGEVVIQSFFPEHSAILACASRDYRTFFDQEIRSRKELGFPPFRFLAKILFRGKKEETVAAASRSFKKSLSRFKKGKKISLLGPAPALLSKSKKDYEWQLLVKSEKENLADILKEPVRRFKTRTVKIIVDIDPY